MRNGKAAFAALVAAGCVAASVAAGDSGSRPTWFAGPSLGVHVSRGSTFKVREYFDETDAYGTAKYEDPVGAGGELSWEVKPGIAPLIAGDLEFASRNDDFDYLLTVGPGLEGRIRPSTNLTLFGQGIVARQFADGMQGTVLQFGAGLEFRLLRRAGIRFSVRGQRHLGDPTNPTDCFGCTPSPIRYEVEDQPIRTLLGLQFSFGPAKELGPSGR